MRRLLALALPALVLVTGCAGPQKLTEKSEHRLAGGDHWQAWQLAIRALDKQPGNPRARAAATAAGASIAMEWERRIRALAEQDTLRAGDQLLEYAQFRVDAARYATIAVSLGWPREEAELRSTCARTHYQLGREALKTHRPKKAHGHFEDAQAFVHPYRDAAALADRAMEEAATRVVLVPFRGARGITAQLADAWRKDLGATLVEHARYTRLASDDAIDQSMPVAQLGRTTRDEAIRLGRKAGAQRMIWGTIGDVQSKTRLEVFRDVVARRVQETGPDGTTTTRWVDVPIEVVARLRDVTVDVSYEVIATKDGASLAQRHDARTASARVVWTSYQPVGDVGAYALVSETTRANQPERCKEIESRWKTVCGDATLRQVLEARVASSGRGRYDRGAMSRIAAGAAFVFLEELPPAEDLAFTALAPCGTMRDDLLKLDAIDDVDLGVASAGDR